MAAILQLLQPPPHLLTSSSPKPMTTTSHLSNRTRLPTLTLSCKANDDFNFPQLKAEVKWFLTIYFLLYNQMKAFAVVRRSALAVILSSYVLSRVGVPDISLAQSSVGFREYIDTFDGYSFKYPQNWIQVRGAGADIFFRDPFVLDENLSVEMSSPSSSRYKSVEDLGSPKEAGEKVLRQYLTEFMSTRLGVRRESNILSTSSRVADDGKTYYLVEVNIKSYANNNELAVMPQDRVARLEWDRRYLSVLGVENKRLYELRIQAPENVFVEEESDLRDVMDSFRVNKVSV
ncbi:PsbP, C-terminal [Dillenia turbinata]|uniref:PsbP, C-terminal n=1 Tax=Dillenia turbinata TaxID=194707 RepID=A0AAN8YSV8_9MAGN